MTHAADGSSFAGTATCPLLDGPSLEVTYTNDAAEVQAWLQQATLTDCQALGFDTETKPSFTKDAVADGPALLQLATADGRCLVVQLAGRPWRSEAMRSLLLALAPALGDPCLPKCGVGLDDDAIELWRATDVPGGPLEVKGRLDLGGVGSAKSTGTTRGLANLTQALLGVTMAKSKKVQMSNWGARPPLSLRQVTYAAADAWAAAAVHAELARRRPDIFNARQQEQEQEQKERTLTELSERRVRRKAVRDALRDATRAVHAACEACLEGEAAGAQEELQAELRGVHDGLLVERRELQTLLDELRPDAVAFYSPEELQM